MSRRRRHLWLALLTLGVCVTAWFGGPSGGAVDRASLATAWLCTALFVLVMILGPLQLVGGRRAALNWLLRRDLGIWTAITGLLHFGLGNIEAMNRPYVQRVTASTAPPGAELRGDFFNWGAASGTLLALVFVVLLMISSNVALRWLGPRWWKRLQRLSYAGFALTIFHGLLFQRLEDRHMLWVLLLAAAGMTALGLQIAGWLAYRRLRREAATAE